MGYLWITVGTIGENLYCNSQLKLWVIILLIENYKRLEFWLRVMIFTDKFFGILVFFLNVVLLFKQSFQKVENDAATYDFTTVAEPGI